MPTFDAKDLESDPEGEAMLARLLYPSPQAQACAKVRGRARLKRGSLLTEAMALPSGSASQADCEPIPAPAS